ncbi:hypothetical protein KIH27_03750 [Mycobacterium sp. M1]|uniref:Transcriptional regulator n=1 Tax=Mycolicibacter acidiphilus TaxID=2835306 RepID=A0ABS5REK0_9MYCO|nr:hypothetical protein [Mycolicibacter acidiphilus]MBS9532698.1 hypothetical protein [Mycolicibacter acidiphilus]
MPSPELCAARTCYDHLAGALGVAVFDGLLRRGALVVDGTCRLGPQADPVFAELGVDLGALADRPASARPLLRCCVDWTEHRPHLAGALGAAVLARAETAGWVRRRPGSRAVDVTTAGQRVFAQVLTVSVAVERARGSRRTASGTTAGSNHG